VTADRKPVRGGASGRSYAPRRTLYKGDKAPPMWLSFMAECRKFREERGMTAKQVALQMESTLAVVSLLEKGVSVPHPWDLTIYLQAIGVEKINIE